MSSVVYLLVNPPGSSEHFEIHGHPGLVKLRGNNKTERREWERDLGAAIGVERREEKARE